MVLSVDLYPHDTAVLDALRGLHIPVGFAEAPEGALEQLLDIDDPLTAYVALDPITTTRSGSAIDPNEDAQLTYQVRIVAVLPETARALVSEVEDALRSVAIPGRVVVLFQPVDGGAVRPDLVTPKVFLATPRFRFWTTPDH